MKQNVVIKVLLVAIVVLLTVNLIRPLLSPSVTHAARPIQYKVVPHPETIGKLPPERAQIVQSLLDQHAKNGWELVVFDPLDYHLIFKK